MLAMAGFALAYVVGEVEEGAALVSRATNLDPNLAIARNWRGWAHLWLGDVDAAIEQLQVALRLSPLDPQIFTVHTGLALLIFSLAATQTPRHGRQLLSGSNEIF